MRVAFASQILANPPISVGPQRIRIVSNARRTQLFHLIDQPGRKMLLGPAVDLVIKLVARRSQGQKA